MWAIIAILNEMSMFAKVAVSYFLKLTRHLHQTLEGVKFLGLNLVGVTSGRKGKNLVPGKLKSYDHRNSSWNV